MTLFSRAWISLAASALLMGNAIAADRTIIVLDASGSMWGQIDGKPKLEIARETLKTVLQTVPADAELGLMAYGHRQKGACSDIELVVPPAPGTAAAITQATDKMKFLGKTPLSEAVRQAAEALRSTEEKATVVLITDGIETCNADPCALGKELEQSGVDFTAHVVGFGLTDDEGKQVACLAENTGGKYIQAGDKAALENALKTVVAAPAPAPAPAPEPKPAPPAKVEYNLVPNTVLKAGGPAPTIDVFYQIFKATDAGTRGDPVESGYNAFRTNLEAGKYILASESGTAKANDQTITIEAGKVAKPVFVLNAGEITLRALPSPGAEPDGDAQIIIDHPGDGESSANYGQVKTVVAAGETKVRVILGAAEVAESLQVEGGQIISKDIIVGVGKAVTNAYYTAGGEKVDSGDLSWKIFKAKKNLDGSRDQASYGFGPAVEYDLPAGDYVAVAEMQAALAEQPFSIKVGELTDVAVTLNAGVVAISAPGGEEFRLFEAKKNLQGERKQVSYGFGEAMQTTLKAGDYVVVTRFAADKPQSETPFTVKAGERTEVAVP
jgi:Ca-activated chloride channel family protein